MARYTAVSNRFRWLKIGERIAFQDGLFETDDPELWAQLQTNEWWGVHIHPRDLPAEPAGQEEAKPDAQPHEEAEAEAPVAPTVRHGRRGTR